MTLKKASASKEAQVFEFQPSGAGIWKYYGGVKINEVAIVRGVALAETDTVGIVACRTWCFIFYVLLVLFEAFIV